MKRGMWLKNVCGVFLVLLLFCMMFAAFPGSADAKTVILIRRVAGSVGTDYDVHDANIVKALGTEGLTIDDTTIPGLGYTIVEVEAGDASEKDTYTQADGDLIFISQTVQSDLPKQHGDDPLPVIQSEASAFQDNVKPSAMFFATGDGSALFAEPKMEIIDNTHDITKIFPLGDLAVSSAEAKLGHITGTIGPGVTTLALVSGTADHYAISVIEANVTGLAANARPGFEPTPGRRVCLGFHGGNNPPDGQNSFSAPTVEGVYLLQRTVQWAMGDPVTAGDVSTPPDLVSSADPVFLPLIIHGFVTSSTKTLDVSNAGDITLEITTATVTGDGFSLLQPDAGAFPISLELDQSELFEVGFDFTLISDPSSTGTLTGTLSISSNDWESTITAISLQVEVLSERRPMSAEDWMLY